MKAPKSKILIDIDGTIINYDNVFVEGALQFEHLIHHFALKTNHYHVFTPADIQNISKLSKEPAFASTSEQGNVALLTKALIDNGYAVIIATSRPAIPAVITSTLEAIRSRNISFSSLIMGCSDKVALCKNSKVDVFIDDSRLLCQRACEFVPLVINFDSKHKLFKNAKMFKKRQFQTASSWKEIGDIISSITPINIEQDTASASDSDEPEH